MLKTALYVNYLYSHVKTAVKLHITVFSGDTEYVCFTFLLHMLFAILICSQHCAKEKYTTVIYNKHKKHSLGTTLRKQCCSTYSN